MAKLRIADVNDFFSLTGGGVRRYHLEKLRYLARREDIEYHLLLPSDRAGVEVHGTARIHHVPALSLGKSGYRLMWNPFVLRRVLRQIRPDVVEVGSPFHTPDWVRFAVAGLDTKVVGFWHANFPVTDVRRVLSRGGHWLGALGERAAWWWARRTYGAFSATMAATECMVDQLQRNGVAGVVPMPLGVDTQMFAPRHRDEALRAQWGARPGDVVLAYAGRLSEEKNFRPLLEAYVRIRETTAERPLLVIAGNGPGQLDVEALAARYPEVRYLGFVAKPREMARVLASVDVVACLCPYETFGLAAVEAMASGAAVLGSAQMSIGELLGLTRAGIALETTTAASVADAWLDLLKPGRAALLGARGRAEVERRWSWKATFERIVGVYEQVMAPPPEPLSAVAALLDTDSTVARPALASSETSEIARSFWRLRRTGTASVEPGRQHIDTTQQL